MPNSLNTQFLNITFMPPFLHRLLVLNLITSDLSFWASPRFIHFPTLLNIIAYQAMHFSNTYRRYMSLSPIQRKKRGFYTFTDRASSAIDRFCKMPAVLVFLNTSKPSLSVSNCGNRRISLYFQIFHAIMKRKAKLKTRPRIATLPYRL